MMIPGLSLSLSPATGNFLGLFTVSRQGQDEGLGDAEVLSIMGQRATFPGGLMTKPCLLGKELLMLRVVMQRPLLQGNWYTCWGDKKDSHGGPAQGSEGHSVVRAVLAHSRTPGKAHRRSQQS